MNPTDAKKVLIAPLDWGLGHATRCIPVIKELLSRGCEVQIASSGDAVELLKKEFPELKTYQLHPYQPEYSDKIPFALKIILQLPKFLNTIRKEHRQVEEIVSKERIDLIISDNRYGCWSKNVKSVFISHQLTILLDFPWKMFLGIVNYFNQSQIAKFDACWVPDFENGITGKLSFSKRIKPRFVGMLSRFKPMELPVRFDALAIVSGPEPQRSFFEAKLKAQLIKSGLKYFIVKGNLAEQLKHYENEVAYSTSKELNELICSSDLIICRSGYSSIMDLSRLGKKVIFVPTPGQTEQEYLAEELERKGIAFYQTQDQFDLTEAMERSKYYSGFVNSQHTPNLLAEAMDDLLKEF